MRIAARVAKLEQACQFELDGCPACGGIDPATGEGPFFPGVVLDAHDGTYYCLCKLCGWSFRAKLTNAEDGSVYATEVTPAEMPV